jgi:hypothetical protein
VFQVWKAIRDKLLQCGQLYLYDVPNPSHVDAEVSVREPVSGPHEVTPWNLGVSLPELRAQVFSRLPNIFKQLYDTVRDQEIV